MDTSALMVGQEVAVRSAYGHGDYSFGWKVARLTEKRGEVIVWRQNTDGSVTNYRFDAGGREMGRAGSSYRATLTIDVVAAREETARMQRTREAITALHEIKDSRARLEWGKEGLIEEVARLEALIAKARAAAELI